MDIDNDNSGGNVVADVSVIIDIVAVIIYGSFA
jgi:hypothetical protein